MSNKSFQEIIFLLKNYWKEKGMCIMQPFDGNVGAGTSHPITFFGAINPNNCNVAYVQPSRRPSDGRLDKNGVRLQHYFQFQVFCKPAINNGLDLFFESLTYIGFCLDKLEVQCLEDNWENPSLGANGVGWEVRINGLEIAQITYFHQMGGINCNISPLEITYGLERLAMLLQNVYSPFDLIWDNLGNTTYGDWFRESEMDQISYNFKESSIECLKDNFKLIKLEVLKLLDIDKPLVHSAYQKTLVLCHLFNLLDARQYFSNIDRQRCLLEIRGLNNRIANLYLKNLNLQKIA